MDMRLEQRSIQMDRPVGSCRETITVDGDVSLPGSLRETTNILHAGAMAVVENAEAAQDRITISGRVIFRVIYTQGSSPQPDAIEAAADFTHSCEMKGALPGGEVSAGAQAVHVHAAVQGGRLHMQTEVHLDVRVTVCEPMEVITGVGMPGVQQKMQRVKLRRTAGRGSGEVLLREEFDLPAELQIQDALGASASVIMQDTAGGQGRIGMSGEVTIEVVHASAVPGKPLVLTRHTLPVSQSVEIRGESGDWLDGRMVIKDVAVASLDPGSGERSLRAEVLLGLTAWSEIEEEAAFLTDAYTTEGDEIRLTKMPIRVKSGAERLHAAESGKASLLLPEHAKPWRTVLAAFAVPVLAGHTQQGSRLIAEGVLETTLVYMTGEGNAPASVRIDVPFRVAFAANAQPEDHVRIAAASVEAAPITSDRAELRYVLHLEAEHVQAEEIQAVTEAAAIPGKATTKDIVLYFTQPGESVWDIARRYRVAESELRSLNPALQGEPSVGQGVVVWRRQQA